jgi:hypothetical protein
MCLNIEIRALIKNAMKTYLKNTNGINLLVLAINLAVLIDCRADDLAIGDFGSASYGDWKMTGTAFKPGRGGGRPARQIEGLKTPATIKWPAARLKATGQRERSPRRSSRSRGNIFPFSSVAATTSTTPV